ncbi:cobalamin-independent methionine synthase II family protein [Deefgea sp. CFH1-16]|uniref:cobalamin-independent methionine synthase II family protein n=1 Tax=Deefgea sp. CFH1-16 TaxID=2675457 RepID=UPI00194033DD|nr:cobalamin-independent methionine synthase II family protein [Deefgea sp. CFH1-16]
MFTIPTEAIGSIPRSNTLMAAQHRFDAGQLNAAQMEPFFDEAVRDTIAALEATGSTIISDGEQRKAHSFATYSVDNHANFSPDGIVIPFQDGHIRQLPRLTAGPFRFARYAYESLALAKPYAHLPMKQAIISVSAMSLFYPPQGIADYPRDAFIDDLLNEQEKEIRGCFAAGAEKVQIDFTEGRLSIKLDPTGGILSSFIDLNNMVLSRFAPEERQRIGVHTCPGADHDSTHSADVDYAELLPSLFELKAGSFYIAMACEKDRVRVLKIIARYIKPNQRAFIGVIDVNSNYIETPEEVCQRILEAAKYIPLAQLGTCDDCGYSPFCDDVSTTRETAFAKIRARVQGTAMAASILNESAHA